MPLDKPDLFNAISVYREIGLKLGRLDKFEKSLDYLDRALQRNPEDSRSLRGRAKYRARANKYVDALNDIETLKEIDSNNIYVSAYESLIKYLCGEFEQALILNLKNQKYRKKPDNFVMGVMHCEDAIRNNISPRAGHPLRDHFKIIRKLAWLKVLKNAKPYQPTAKYKKKKKKTWIEEKENPSHQLAAPEVKKPKQVSRRKSVMEGTRLSIVSHVSSSVKKLFASKEMLSDESSIKESLNSSRHTGEDIPPLDDFPFRPIQRYTKNIKNLMTGRYLGSMCHDKKFLDVLLTHPGIESPNTETSKKILKLARTTSKMIFESQELLRTRRPFYFIRLKDAISCGKLEERQLITEQSIKKSYQVKSAKLIEKMKVAMTSKRMRDVVDTAEQIFEFCENKSTKTLPNRHELLNNVYTLVRDAFYEIKRVKSSMTYSEKRLRTSVLLGMPQERQELSFVITSEFECPFENKKKKCLVIEERVRKSTSRELQIWFYHELTRLFYDRKLYELSRGYATKCLKEAYVIGDKKWIVNAMFTIIKNDIAVKNTNGAKIGLRRCQNVVTVIGDGELMETTCLGLDMLDEEPVETNLAKKIIERRVKKIMDIVTSESAKEEGTLIFRRMSALPARRRLSVLPGIVHLKSIERGRKNQSEEKHNSKTTKKVQTKLEDRDKALGASFMHLIQDYQ